jgi:hypothetical protein
MAWYLVKHRDSYDGDAQLVMTDKWDSMDHQLTANLITRGTESLRLHRIMPMLVLTGLKFRYTSGRD